MDSPDTQKNIVHRISLLTKWVDSGAPAYLETWGEYWKKMSGKHEENLCQNKSILAWTYFEKIELKTKPRF